MIRYCAVNLYTLNWHHKIVINTSSIRLTILKRYEIILLWIVRDRTAIRRSDSLQGSDSPTRIASQKVWLRLWVWTSFRLHMMLRSKEQMIIRMFQSCLYVYFRNQSNNIEIWLIRLPAIIWHFPVRGHIQG